MSVCSTILGAVLAAVVLSGCTGRPDAEATVAVDGPVWSSVAELAADADVVVVGVVGEKLDASSGTSDRTSAYHRFEIDDVLAGAAEPDEVLLWLDTDRVSSMDLVRPLVEGGRVVVFADRVRADEVDGGLPASSVLAPLMYDNGTLDVEGTTLTARSAWLVDLGASRPATAAGPTMGVPQVTTLDELRVALDE